MEGGRLGTFPSMIIVAFVPRLLLHFIFDGLEEGSTSSISCNERRQTLLAVWAALVG